MAGNFIKNLFCPAGRSCVILLCSEPLSAGRIDRCHAPARGGQTSLPIVLTSCQCTLSGSERVPFSETSVSFCQATRRSIPEAGRRVVCSCTARSARAAILLRSVSVSQADVARLLQKHSSQRAAVCHNEDTNRNINIQKLCLFVRPSACYTVHSPVYDYLFSVLACSFVHLPFSFASFLLPALYTGFTQNLLQINGVVVTL